MEALFLSSNGRISVNSKHNHINQVASWLGGISTGTKKIIRKINFRLDNQEKKLFSHFNIRIESITSDKREVVFRVSARRAIEIQEIILNSGLLAYKAGYENPSKIASFLRDMQDQHELLKGASCQYPKIVEHNITDAEVLTPTVLLLSPEEVQERRDEIKRMVYNGKPDDELPLYPGKKYAPDAVLFFKKHYSRYIVKNQEVIFAPELMAIDAPLMRALRNECRNPSNKMPIGTIEDRTDARNMGRFSDGKNASISTRSAIQKRRNKEAVSAVLV